MSSNLALTALRVVIITPGCQIALGRVFFYTHSLIRMLTHYTRLIEKEYIASRDLYCDTCFRSSSGR